jgi:hypothetical protein
LATVGVKSVLFTPPFLSGDDGEDGAAAVLGRGDFDFPSPNSNLTPLPGRTNRSPNVIDGAFAGNGFVEVEAVLAASDASIFIFYFFIFACSKRTDKVYELQIFLRVIRKNYLMNRLGDNSYVEWVE